MKVWRITLWRILLYLEDIAILGDFALHWFDDYWRTLLDVLVALPYLEVTFVG